MIGGATTRQLNGGLMQKSRSLTLASVGAISTMGLLFSGSASANPPGFTSPGPGYSCTGVVTFEDMYQQACIEHLSGHPVDESDQFEEEYPYYDGGSDIYTNLEFFGQIRYGSSTSVPVKVGTVGPAGDLDGYMNEGGQDSVIASWPYKAGLWLSTGFARWTNWSDYRGNHGAGGTDPSHVATIAQTY